MGIFSVDDAITECENCGVPLFISDIDSIWDEPELQGCYTILLRCPACDHVQEYLVCEDDEVYQEILKLHGWDLGC